MNGGGGGRGALSHLLSYSVTVCISEHRYSAPHNSRVKYQESSIGFENLAHLQSIENKCKAEVCFPMSQALIIFEGSTFVKKLEVNNRQCRTMELVNLSCPSECKSSKLSSVEC